MGRTARGFVIYPGKMTSADSFRIGTIGDLRPHDIDRLVQAVRHCMDWIEDDPQPERTRPSFAPQALRHVAGKVGLRRPA